MVQKYQFYCEKEQAKYSALAAFWVLVNVVLFWFEKKLNISPPLHRVMTLKMTTRKVILFTTVAWNIFLFLCLEQSGAINAYP